MSKVELAHSFKSLMVYKKPYGLAKMIFELSKSSPKEERYSHSDQKETTEL